MARCTFDDGAIEEFDLVVGCDGIGSQVPEPHAPTHKMGPDPTWPDPARPDPTRPDLTSCPDLEPDANYHAKVAGPDLTGLTSYEKRLAIKKFEDEQAAKAAAE